MLSGTTEGLELRGRSFGRYDVALFLPPPELVARLSPRPSRLSERSGPPLLAWESPGAIAAFIAAAHVWNLIFAFVGRKAI